jgi:hypothetical protein
MSDDDGAAKNPSDVNASIDQHDYIKNSSRIMALHDKRECNY